MSSWKNAFKSRAKNHKERGQLAARAHLGMLEKKKDYKIRALDHQKKKNTLKALQRKALERNPDEFYFNMVKTEKKDGVHQLRETEEDEHTEDQLKLMCTQDQRYVNMKRSSELKKIERLKASLHLIDGEETPKNKHTIFVDSKKKARAFDAAKHFNTHPALVGRKFNRPTMESLQRGDFVGVEQSAIQGSSVEKDQRYNELRRRIEREKKLSIIAQKMQVKKQLLKKEKGVQRDTVAAQTKNAPGQYKWKFKRKR